MAACSALEAKGSKQTAQRFRQMFIMDLNEFFYRHCSFDVLGVIHPKYQKLF